MRYTLDQDRVTTAYAVLLGAREGAITSNIYENPSKN
jgi:hypothetical protein